MPGGGSARAQLLLLLLLLLASLLPTSSAVTSGGAAIAAPSLSPAAVASTAAAAAAPTAVDDGVSAQASLAWPVAGSASIRFAAISAKTTTCALAPYVGEPATSQASQHSCGPSYAWVG